MNRSYSKIRHIQEANKRLENKLILEKIGDPLTPESANSQKAKITKTQAQFLNSYYKMNLSAAQTGNWSDKDFNDTLKKYMEEKQIPIWICKKGDGYCNDEEEGIVTTKDIGKLVSSMKPTEQQDGGTINTTHDKTYDYKLKDGKYYYQKKNSPQPQWIEAKGKGLETIKKNVKFVQPG